MSYCISRFLLIAAALGSVSVHAASYSVTVFRNGAVEKHPTNGAIIADAAYCAANPNVLFHFNQSVTPTPDAQGRITSTRASGTIALNFSVTMDQVCLAGQTTVRLDYGILPGGTAVAGTDYTSPGTAAITFSNLAQYATATQSMPLNVAILSSQTSQTAVTIPVGFVAGAYVFTPSNTNNLPQAGAIQSDNVPLATVVINPGLTTSQATTLLQNAGAGDPVAVATAQSFATMCTKGNLPASLQAKCDAVLAAAQVPGQASAVATALRGVATEETSSQSESVAQAQVAQTGNIGQRMTALRAGTHGGLSLNGLSVQQGGFVMPLDFLDDAVAKVAGSNDASSAPQELTSSPWGMFVNGSLGRSDRDRTGLEDGYTQDTSSLTFGGDYRFSQRFVAGLAYTWGRVSGDLRDQSGKLSTQARALSAYATLDWQSWYAQFTYGVGPVTFDQQRTIRYTVGTDSENQTAVSRPDGQAHTGNAELGWYWNKQAWSLTPSLRIDYQNVTIDSYSEHSGGDFNLFVNKQHQQSLRYSLGFNAGYTHNVPQGVLIPSFDLRIYRETKNDTRAVQSHFLEDPNAVLFQVPTESPDRMYGVATIGIQGLFPHGVQAYANYQRIVGEQFYSIGVFNIGMRIEL